MPEARQAPDSPIKILCPVDTSPVHIFFGGKMSQSMRNKKYRVCKIINFLDFVGGSLRAAGAKILKWKPPNHGFPTQKRCFWSVSEAFSTAQTGKTLQNFRAFGPKKEKM